MFASTHPHYSTLAITTSFKGDKSLHGLSAKHQRLACEDEDGNQAGFPQQSELVWRHIQQKLT